MEQQSSGVKVESEIPTLYEEFKLKKTLRYYTYKIEKKKLIKIDAIGQIDATYDDFCKEFPEAEPRYGIIDLEFETKDGRPTSKIVFISWNPDVGKIGDKMIYASSKESMKTALPGVGIFINATDRAELDLEESILPVVKKFA